MHQHLINFVFPIAQFMEYAIAIDIGGTTTSLGIVDRKGEILAKCSIPTRGEGTFEEFFKRLYNKIEELISLNGIKEKITRVGIGAPCANPYTGEIEGATDLPWPSPIPLKEIFERAMGIPVALGNDAKSSAIGEMMFGAAKGLNNFIMLTLGTGVGAGIVCDGHLLYGSRGFAGELGHVTVRHDKSRLCGCGRYDCLQNYCSASGVVETARCLLRDSSEDSLLRHINESAITPKLVYECAEKGDSLSLKVFEETGKVIGEACANFAAFTDPEAIIFFGGVAKALKFMEPAIRKAMEENLLFLYKKRIKLLASGLEEADVALLGASALAFENK